MYERVAILPIEPVLRVIRQAEINERAGQVLPPRQEVLGHTVGVSSVRLRTFASQPLCCSNPDCGLVPGFFAVERHAGKNGARPDAPYHLNLYGYDAAGAEVLFTQDHTTARALGGADDLTNTTTMCAPCNSAKSEHERLLVKDLRFQQGLEKAPDHGSKTQQRLLTTHQRLLAQLMQRRGMSHDDAQAWCNAEGQAEAFQCQALTILERQNLRRVAQALGLTPAGLAALRHAEGRTVPASASEEPVAAVGRGLRLR